MSADLTLPGSIPGLLRRGSPVTRGGHRSGTVAHIGPRGWLVVDDEALDFDADAYDRSPGHSAGTDDIAASGWDLDLTDATGRAHAAWWVRDHWRRDESYHVLTDELGPGHYGAIVGADQGDDMDEDEIRRLRAVVLHVAGVPS